MLEVAAARLSDDGRRVRLEVPALEATQCLAITYSLRGEEGSRVEGEIHATIHSLHE